MPILPGPSEMEARSLEGMPTLEEMQILPGPSEVEALSLEGMPIGNGSSLPRTLEIEFLSLEASPWKLFELQPGPLILSLDALCVAHLDQLVCGPPCPPNVCTPKVIQCSPCSPTEMQSSPCTPTGIECSPCAPTEVDTDVDTPRSPPMRLSLSPPQKRRRTDSMPQTQPDYEDPLLNDLSAFMDASPAQSTPDAYDPDDTDNEDPMADRRGLQLITAALHWSGEEKFWDKVEDKLRSSVLEPWFHTRFFTTSALMQPWGFEACVMEIVSYIRAKIQGKVLHYKIGITGEEPLLRWTRTDCGYAWDHLHSHSFTGMELLYAAPCSNSKQNETTGRMEVRLNNFFNWDLDPACLNRPGGGGECASKASPHFVYVVW